MLGNNYTKNSLIRLSELNFSDYAVASDGNVYSYKKGEKFKLKSPPDTQGYRLVRLFRNGKSKTFYVHRLVATCFLPNPENKKYVIHLNDDRTDNRACNLQWANAIEFNSKKLKVTPTLKKEIKFLYYTVGLTQYEVAEMISVSQTTVCNALRKIKENNYA